MKSLIFTKTLDLALAIGYLALPAVGLAGPAATGSGDTDKSQFHLFNPTPREFMRELSPDRPDATESPITLDAGHVAFEVSMFDWRHNDGDNAYTLMATNFKLGLTNSIDFQVVFDAYAWERPDMSDELEGFGDVQLRLKWNVWGNDSGDTALALFPFVKIPTGTELSNSEVEGGLIVPFSVGLTGRVGLGLMAEFDAVYDDEEGDHDFEFLHSAVLGFDLTDRAGMFAEYIGVTGSEKYRSFVAGGFTFQVDQDLILDVGTQIGLNENSEDVGVFAGFTKRF